MSGRIMRARIMSGGRFPFRLFPEPARRVESMTSPRVTAPYAVEREDRALQGTVLRQCLDAIMGACRLETARGTDVGREHELVSPHQNDKNTPRNL